MLRYEIFKVSSLRNPDELDFKTKCLLTHKFCGGGENIDTTTSGGRLIFHLFGALAEFERTLIRERTQAGVNAARARGRQGGRPKLLETNKRALAIRLHRERQHTIAEICQMMGISKSTLYNYLAEASPNVINKA